MHVSKQSQQRAIPQNLEAANPECEKGDVAVVKKLIKEVWVHGQGSIFIVNICRNPMDGRLQEFNVYLKEWLPLTDSDLLVSDVSKLLSILLDLIDMGGGAEKPCTALQANTSTAPPLLCSSAMPVPVFTKTFLVRSRPGMQVNALQGHCLLNPQGR